VRRSEVDDRRPNANGNKLPTQQSVSAAVKRICDITSSQKIGRG